MLQISQPALSKQILNLENDLGIKLFDRSTTPLSLTPAGEFFLHEAQQLLYREDQLLRSISQFKSGEKGRLDIGISPFRNLYLMPPIIEKLKEEFPGLQVVLHELESTRLHDEATEGKFDFSILNLPVKESMLDTLPLERELLVLAVPNHLAADIPYVQGPLCREVDFSDCRDLPFVVLAHPQQMRIYFDSLCSTVNFIPNIAVEVSGGVSTAWAMAHAGIGATLLPLQFVNFQNFDNTLTMFSLKDNTYSRQPVIATKKGQYLSEYAKYAIDLLANK